MTNDRARRSRALKTCHNHDESPYISVKSHKDYCGQSTEDLALCRTPAMPQWLRLGPTMAVKVTPAHQG